ncbi:hypothetical protein ZIOFF_006752 [Zingiber officinale]|uniref:EF-hand domain-containing protein n=1 Tax=Zingiber officinale TaxID=94328 RepID=A0A8J5HP27_ZINOF|nr:hypothetical protein ZIOFF_006752 [Zingiber officinale]
MLRVWAFRGALFTEEAWLHVFFSPPPRSHTKGGWLGVFLAPPPGLRQGSSAAATTAMPTPLKLEDCLHRLILDPPSTDEVAHLVTDIDHDGDDSISLDEFIVLEAAGDLHLVDGRSKLCDAFAFFDSDDDGKISGRGAARRALVALGR